MPTIYLTPKQREAKKLLDQNTVLLYGGGIRGGKSYFLLLTILTYCFKFPKSRWVVIRQSMPTLKRNLFPTFNKLLDAGFRQYMIEWNQTTQEVTFNNGSQIIFMSENYDDDKELNRFRGLEINGGAIDELNECNEKTFYKLIERAGSWNESAAPIKIICTCNPSHTWVKELIYDPWKNGNLKKGWAFISALITDNPYIPADYLQSLINNMPEYEYEVFVKGNWDLKLEGALFDQNEFHFFTMKDLKFDGLECIAGYIDVADEGTDSLAFVLGYVFNQKVFIVDVIFSKDSIDITTPQCASLIKSHVAKDEKGIVTRDVDYVVIETNNQGGGFIRELSRQWQEGRIIPVRNSASKHTRILTSKIFINRHVYFRNDYERGSEYDKFMREVYAYRKDGKAEHDDAPDALAGLARFIERLLPNLFSIEVN